MRISWLLILCVFVSLVTVGAQTTPEGLKPILEQELQPTAVTAYQLSRFLMARIPQLPTPVSASQWTSEEKRLRDHLLNDVVFHGWPREWLSAAPKFEEVNVIETGKGYRMHMLRYEIVPGFDSTAILYEPVNGIGRVPAILNVNGHDPQGKAAEYKQKRCINFAKRGILALSLEWPGFGELSQPENAHDYGAHLDLVGANSAGFFYLAIRRGLDYLASLPQVDSARLGVTGLSGGGWQTIFLSALDPRVAVMVEVAGFGSLQSNITHPVDTNETEENPADLCAGEDYTYLVAMRAPRPTLLVHNAEDDCCFRAALVKPYIYDDIKPFFRVFDKENDLAWHENEDPGTHNYQLNNRQTAYRFFTEHFNMPVAEDEIPSDREIKSSDDLTIGVPKENLTILGLARKMASEIHRDSIPSPSNAKKAWASEKRGELQSVLRYKPLKVSIAWRLWNTRQKGLETLSYRFDFDNGLSATGVWLKAIAAPSNAPATIVLEDGGRKDAANVISDLINRGEQVLALDPMFMGEMIPQKPDPTDYELLVATVGARPLGIEVEQLLGVANWLTQASGQREIRLETTGIRSEVVGLAAAALDPNLFSAIATRRAMRSLGHLLDTPVAFRSAPELFCLDLYRDFDIDRLAALAERTKVEFHSYAGER